MTPTTKNLLKVGGIGLIVIATTASVFTHPAIFLIATGSIGYIYNQYTKNKKK